VRLLNLKEINGDLSAGNMGDAECLVPADFAAQQRVRFVETHPHKLVGVIHMYRIYFGLIAARALYLVAEFPRMFGVEVH